MWYRRTPIHSIRQPVNLMLKILDDPSPSPSTIQFSPEFYSFIAACLPKGPDSRPTADQMITIHYYLCFDGSEEVWQHAKALYKEGSVFSFSGKQFIGPDDIYASLSNLRRTLAGDWPPARLGHVMEKLQCRGHGEDGLVVRASRSFIVGNQFLICGDGLQAEGRPNFKDIAMDLSSKRMDRFRSSSYWSRPILLEDIT